MITKDDYCINVCGAKCCRYLNPERACPNLTPDNKCGVYQYRYTKDAPEFEIVGWYKVKDNKGLTIIKPFVCGMIEKMLARNELPSLMKAQCCYAHPELLTEYNDDGTKSSDIKRVSNDVEGGQH